MKKTISPLAASLLALSLGIFGHLSCGSSSNSWVEIDPTPSVAVTGLTLNRNTMTLAVGHHMGRLVPLVSPHNAFNKNVVWSSSNPDAVWVSVDGVVNPLKTGTATITATTRDGDKTAECFVEVVANPVPARGASLNKNELYITEGGSGYLDLSFIPSNSTNQNVTWRSSNASVATVDPFGFVTARAEGTAEIIATFDPLVAGTASGGNSLQAASSTTRSATIKVGSKSQAVAATRIEVNPQTLNLSVGASGLLIPTVFPSNATNTNVSFSSSVPSVASVSSTGLVTANSVGSATVMVTTEDGGYFNACAVNVTTANSNPTGVSLNDTEISLGLIGDTDRLVATVSPSNATDKSLYWYSSDESIAAVDMNGTVQARAVGTAVVTAETRVGGRKATCNVTVRGTNTTVPVTGVTLNKSTMTLAVNGTETLTATVVPSNATNKRVNWQSSNPAVAAVTNSGTVTTVTGVAAGTATITVTTVDGSKTANCVVTVGNPTVPVTNVTLNKDTMTLAVNGTETLVATVVPSTATNKAVTWSSSNQSVATVSGSGLTATATAVAVGTATITVTTVDGGKTASCTVTVSNTTVPVTGVALNKNTMTLAVNGTETLTATVVPSTATNRTVTWASSAPGFATVSTGGLVTAKAAGSAIITVTTVDGGKTDTCAVTVTGGTTSVPTAIAAGNGHSLAVNADGSLWVWGYNNYGQLGDGTQTNRNAPIQLGNDKNWKTVSAGYSHSLAIKEDGSLWSWGRNDMGQLGDGTQTNRNRPTRVGTDADWKMVSAGYSHTLAIKNDNSLWAWGSNFYGQLGINAGGTFNDFNAAPVRVGTATDWKSVSARWNHSFAIKNDGTLWAWGRNDQGQLGNGKGGNLDDFEKSPVQVGTDRKWDAVAACEEHAVAISSDGSLWAWGSNSYGQLGDGTNEDYKDPVRIGSASDWTGVPAGSHHTLALKGDGSALYAWGRNQYGQTGDGTTTTTANSPKQVDSTNNWKAVVAGTNHSIALKADGTIWAWGRNQYGQLGDNTNIDRSKPIQVGSAATPIPVTSVAINKKTMSLAVDGTETLTAAVKPDNATNKAVTWGSNAPGIATVNSSSGLVRGVAVGTATITVTAVADSSKIDTCTVTVTASTSPVVVTGNTTLAAGYTHSLAIKADNSLWAWGYNNFGQLGDGSTTTRTAPVQVGSDNDWAAVTAGGNHTLAIKQDGTLWAWGSNQYGQLGDGTRTSRETPVQVRPSDKWAAVAAGGDHTLAIRADNTLWAWGRNQYGQLGDNTNSSRNAPVQVGTDKTWKTISAGVNHSVAIKSEGTLWVWGENSYYQLGLNNTTPQSIPTQVGTDKTWASVSAGLDFTMAVKSDKSDATLWRWGYNDWGQLGIIAQNTNQKIPGQLGDEKIWKTASASLGSHTVALKAPGTLWRWGFIIGQTPTTDSSGNMKYSGTVTPTKVGGDTNWVAVSAGEQHALALKSNGNLYAWGANYFGQLGDGTIAEKTDENLVLVGTGFLVPKQ